MAFSIYYSTLKGKITSPGGIFNATTDDIMNGIQTYRNAHLVNVFDKLGLIENFGTGIPRTMSSYSEYTVKPVFQESTNYFIVTLPNVNYANDQINDQINDRINDLGLMILKAINDKQESGYTYLINYSEFSIYIS